MSPSERGFLVFLVGALVVFVTMLVRRVKARRAEGSYDAYSHE